jgi:serine/threonine-protein kinase
VPTAPSELRPGVDPVVERVIIRCLERDPRQRPASAAQVAAALPGGDPLAAAIAAGETPSPEMVAASGERHGLRPGNALLLLALTIAGAAAAAALNPAATMLGRAKLNTSPQVLAERVRTFLFDSGYRSSPVDRAFGFVTDDAFLSYWRDQPQGLQKMDAWGRALFWYRESPHPLSRLGLANAPSGHAVTESDPPMSAPGELLVHVDADGRLREFRAVPPQMDQPSRGTPTDWNVLFKHAGLDSADWTAVTPARTPPVYADERAAWEGKSPAIPDVPLRIEAAAHRGRVVSFMIVGPWTDATAPGYALAAAFVVTLLGVLLAGGGFFAHRNIRSGRGDRRGAFRLVSVLCAIWTTSWLVSADHVSTLGEFYGLALSVSLMLLTMGLTWVMYVSLEPFVRRRWPTVLVSWTRLLAGEWRDPQLGRDVLVGCTAGVGFALFMRILILAPEWFGFDAVQPIGFRLEPLGSLGQSLGAILDSTGAATVLGVGCLFQMFFLRVIMRSERLAATAVAGTLGLFVAMSNLYNAPWFFKLGPLVLSAFLVFLLIRFGLVALIVALFVWGRFNQSPVTLDTSAWYAGIGYASLVVIALAAFYGFRTSLGGRRVFELADL